MQVVSIERCVKSMGKQLMIKLLGSIIALIIMVFCVPYVTTLFGTLLEGYFVGNANIFYWVFYGICSLGWWVGVVNNL